MGKNDDRKISGFLIKDGRSIVIWSRGGANKGGAWGYFNKADPFATPDVPTIEELKELKNIPNIDDYKHILDIPNIDKILDRQIQELGAISPSQIKNASGHLQEGFKLKAGEHIVLSDEASVGSGTFKGGGAVGLLFHYPIVLTFYAMTDDLSANFEEIVYSSVSGGYTHDYWKGILEGYSESSTLDSRDNFKYREYIKDGQSMYEITETTEIIITVNKDNINLYTHAHAPDGEYYIRIWLDDINLANTNFTNINNAYNMLGTLKGIIPLDEIEIMVKGSLYDDTN